MVGLPKRPEIPPKDFGQAMGVEPSLVLPFDAQLFGMAANNGQMIFEVAPESKVAQGIDQLAARTDGQGDPGREALDAEEAAGQVGVGDVRQAHDDGRTASRAAAAGGGPRRVAACRVRVRLRRRSPQQPPRRAVGCCADDDPPPPPPKPRAKPSAPTAHEPPRRPLRRRRRRKRSPQIDNRSDEYYRTKTEVFNALIDTIDLTQLAQLDQESAREEIRDIVIEIISIKNVVMSIAEQETLLDDICNDVLGYGPLEPLLARDDIADIMVNGAGTTFIEVDGKIQRPTSASATTGS